MNKLTIFFKSIGISSINDFPKPFSYNCNDYNLKDSIDAEKILQHRDFLKTALEEENNRLGFIENKTSQIISQTSIVFSLIGLFIPIIIDKFGDIFLWIKFILIILILFAFALYLLSITNALKNFNVNQFRYPVPYPGNVLDFKDKSAEAFNSEIIRDYLYCINESIVINNKKATNLLHAYKTFKLANYFTGILVLCICFLIMFVRTEKPQVSTENIVQIDTLDKALKKSRPIIIYQRDTIKITDTIYIKK